MPYVVKNSIRYFKPCGRVKKKIIENRRKLYDLCMTGRLISDEYLKQIIERSD